MENNHQNQRPDIDDFLYKKLLQALELGEGVLTLENARTYFGFSNDAQFEIFLKTQNKFSYQISFVEKVIPQFTKHEIINDLKNEYFNLRSKYVFLKPPEPEWFL